MVRGKHGAALRVQALDQKTNMCAYNRGNGGEGKIEIGMNRCIP